MLTVSHVIIIILNAKNNIGTVACILMLLGPFADKVHAKQSQ